ncbi:MAG: molybdenum ABC transporter ATP-binding protein [Alphaproteobacteria bacterium]
MAASPGIEAEIALTRGAFALDVAFAAEPGRITALFGPSGCGKTTTINCVAGLDRPSRGRIAIGGSVVFDAAARIRLAPERRRVGYVFQEGRLFPHMTVRDNLLYGRRRSRRGAGGPQPELVIELLGLAALLDRRPAGLSGGERQRVALGRAILADAEVLLLDEPLAALDAARKAQILPFIEELRDRLGLTMLYVSHDLREVARIADRMLMMDGGRIVAAGPVSALSQSEEHHARFVAVDGGTVLDAQVCGKDLVHEMLELRLAGRVIRVPGFPASVGARVRLRIDPQDVAIAVSEPSGLSIRNIIPGSVRALVPFGPAQADVAIACGDSVIWARVTVRAVHELGLAPGKPVFALVKAVAVDRSYR